MPAAERPDHIARMSGRTAAQDDAPEQDKPQVPSLLVSYLDTTFTRPVPRVAMTQDGLVELAAEQAKQAGREEVIDHLRALIRT